MRRGPHGRPRPRGARATSKRMAAISWMTLSLSRSALAGAAGAFAAIGVGEPDVSGGRETNGFGGREEAGQAEGCEDEDDGEGCSS